MSNKLSIEVVKHSNEDYRLIFTSDGYKKRVCFSSSDDLLSEILDCLFADKIFTASDILVN